MKTVGKLFAIVAALSLALALYSCDNRMLPRGGADEFACFDEAGDRVFKNVWSEGTQELHGLMILKDGKVVYEKYAPVHTADELHVMWSDSKQ